MFSSGLKNLQACGLGVLGGPSLGGVQKGNNAVLEKAEAEVGLEREVCSVYEPQRQ